MFFSLRIVYLHNTLVFVLQYPMDPYISAGYLMDCVMSDHVLYYCKKPGTSKCYGVTYAQFGSPCALPDGTMDPNNVCS